MSKVNKLDIPLYASVLSGHQVVSLVNTKIPETFQTLERKALVINADFQANKWMDRGNAIEPLIQDYIADNPEQFGIKEPTNGNWLGNLNYITQPKGYTVAADLAVISTKMVEDKSVLDMEHEENLIIEIKSANTDKSWAKYQKRCEKDHMIQLAWYMKCTGVKKGKVIYAGLPESKYELKTEKVEKTNDLGHVVAETIQHFPAFKDYTDLKDMEFVTYDLTWEDVEKFFTPEVQKRVDAYMKCVETSKNTGTISGFEDMFEAFGVKGFWQEQDQADPIIRSNLELYKSYKGALRMISADIKLLIEEDATDEEIKPSLDRQKEIKSQINVIEGTVKDTLEASGLDCIIYPEVMLRIPTGRQRSYIVDRLDDGITVLTDSDREYKMKRRAMRNAA